MKMNWLYRFYFKFKIIIYKIFLRLSLTFSKLENNLLKNTENDIYSGDSNEINNIQNSLLRSLQKGEFNQEYVTKFYNILKLTDNILDNSNNYNISNIIKKHGMDSGNHELNNYVLNNVNTKKNIDTDIINVIKNNIHIKNPEYIVSGEQPIKISTIKSKDINRKNKIEEFTEFLYIKKYKDDLFLLEFHIKLIDNINFDEINNIYYKDKYGDNYEYEIIEMQKSKKTKTNLIYNYIGKKI